MDAISKMLVCGVFLLGLTICSGNTNAESVVGLIEQDSFRSVATEIVGDASTLINEVYGKFVFPIDSTGEDNPDDYFTTHALEKLQSDFEFDCDQDHCYAFYALRTAYQDSKPGVEDESRIIVIHPQGDGWYEVSYIDMGWDGKTRIKVVDGKIDDYERSR